MPRKKIAPPLIPGSKVGKAKLSPSVPLAPLSSSTAVSKRRSVRRREPRGDSFNHALRTANDQLAEALQEYHTCQTRLAQLEGYIPRLQGIIAALDPRAQQPVYSVPDFEPRIEVTTLPQQVQIPRPRPVPVSPTSGKPILRRGPEIPSNFGASAAAKVLGGFKTNLSGMGSIPAHLVQQPQVEAEGDGLLEDAGGEELVPDLEIQVQDESA